METKIKFKVLKDRRVRTITLPIEHPEFQIIPETVFNGLVLPETSIEYQIMGYLDNMDKSQLMLDNDIAVIFDYWIPKPKTKADEVKDFEEYCDLLFAKVPSIRTQFVATVKALSTILFGHRKSNETKAREVLAHMEATCVYTTVLMCNLLDSFKDETVTIEVEESEQKKLN